MQKTVSIKVYGKVQGVFFRQSTKEKADELSIKGTVRNTADGSVFIEASGDETALGQFIEWCRTGPRKAIVSGIEMNEMAAQSFTSFIIIRH